jgi:predicted RNase H-like HicB family nuclease
MALPLTAYIEAAMEMATYDKLEDGSFAGEIPKFPGVVAFAKTLRACERELRETLEDWLLVGLRLGYKPPRINGDKAGRRPSELNLNRDFVSSKKCC